MRSERPHIHFQGYGHTHHFCVCRCGELGERKEIELWRLRQSLIYSIFCTGKRVKCKYGGVLDGSYFERIWLSPRTRLERIWVNSVVTSCGTAESIEPNRLIKETVWILGSRTEGGMEVEEKHIYRNHFIGRNKTNCIPLTNRALGGVPAGVYGRPR
jgi:hypothetical protein